MSTVSVVETLGLAVLWRVGLHLVEEMIEGVPVGDVVLQTVPPVLLPRLLTDHSSRLTGATVVTSGVRTVRQESLGASTLQGHQPSYINLHLHSTTSQYYTMLYIV